MSKKIKFGVMLHGPGGHMHAWKSDEVPSDASVNFDHYIDITKRAENAGFSFVFVADGLFINEKSIPQFLNRFEPITLLASLASVTTRIGLVGTISTTYSEPFTIARQLMTIDKLSNGRAGWNIVTSPLEGSADNYNKGEHPEHDKRYDIAKEHLEVVQGLWDSYEDDAFTRNVNKGEYVDTNKMHKLNYDGEYYKVKGPLNISRSEQGQPLIFQAGSSSKGVEFAAKYADAIFTNAIDIESSKEKYKNIKSKVQALGRNPEEVGVYPTLSPIIAPTEAEAEERYKYIQNLVTVDEALDYLGRYYDHHDFKQYPLDEPFPELGDVGKNSFRSTTESIEKRARENHLTLREVALEETTRRSSFFGTYEQVAHQIIKWIDGKAADGFILTPHILGNVYKEFIENVIPILVKEGYYQTNYDSTTLRSHLGVPFKPNRYEQQSINI